MNEPRGSVTGKRIILEIVREMREGLHPLLYSRVAPGLYCVYLHPEDFARIEGLVPRIRAEAGRALSDELSRLNDVDDPARRRGQLVRQHGRRRRRSRSPPAAGPSRSRRIVTTR